MDSEERHDAKLVLMGVAMHALLSHGAPADKGSADIADAAHDVAEAILRKAGA